MAMCNSLIGTAVRYLMPAGLLALGLSGPILAQTDPGVRTGAINGQTGATATSPLPLASVTANTPQGVSEFFTNGLGRFQGSEVVSGGAEQWLRPPLQL